MRRCDGSLVISEKGYLIATISSSRPNMNSIIWCLSPEYYVHRQRNWTARRVVNVIARLVQSALFHFISPETTNSKSAFLVNHHYGQCRAATRTHDCRGRTCRLLAAKQEQKCYFKYPATVALWAAYGITSFHYSSSLALFDAKTMTFSVLVFNLPLVLTRHLLFPENNDDSNNSAQHPTMGTFCRFCGSVFYYALPVSRTNRALSRHELLVKYGLYLVVPAPNYSCCLY